MLKDPEALVHMKKAEEIAEQYDPTLYQVVYTSLDI